MEKSHLQNRSEKYILRLRKIFWGFLKWILRIEISGLENIPAGGCMLVANHNSGALLESHSLLFALAETGRKVYGLNHPALFKIPFVSSHFKKIGAVTANREASYEVLNSGHSLLIFPGGNRQAFRPWRLRHENAFPWAHGWADIAASAKVPVVPIKFIGSHNSNPILFSSSWLSKALILPWILGVKWFPFSFGQAAWTLMVVLACLASDFSLPATFVSAYWTFCLTPLIPVLPARVQIKIYPPIDASKVSTDALEDQMALLMNRRDYPHGPRKVYPLNGLERFMFLHESETVRYNSHFIYDFKGDLNKEKIMQTTTKWLMALPQVRSAVFKGLWQSQRYCYDLPWFEAEDIVQFSDRLDAQLVDDFCNRPFRLNMEPAVRFLVLSDGTFHKMIFSCHHSLFDGAAHAYAFEEWSRLYNNQAPDKKWAQVETFRFRSIIKKVGLWNSLAIFVKNFSFKPPRIQMNVASLVNGRTDVNARFVRSRTLQLFQSVSLRDDFYELALKVLDATLREKGDMQNPVIAYMPAGLRWTLKVKASLQNILVSHTLFLNRKAFVDNSLKERITKKLKSDPLQANSKFLFGVLPLCSYGNEQILRRQFASLDSNKATLTSSLLLVSAAIPNGYVTPRDWQNLFIAARGTLVRSPGLGLIFTGKKGYETITVEYLEGLVAEADVDFLIQNFLTALQDFQQKKVSLIGQKAIGLPEEIF